MSDQHDIREWYYSDGASGAQKGPVPAVVLSRLLEKGVGVTGQTLVWKAGMDQWLPAANVTHPSCNSIYFDNCNSFYRSLFDISPGRAIPVNSPVQRDAVVLH
jgi:hypothetical protein